MPFRVLVTGANGFIGRNVTNHLLKKGFQLISTDLQSADITGDVSENEFVFKRLSDQDFNTIVHLAALTNIQKSTEETYSFYKVNIMGTLNMLELGLRKAVRRFVYLSSANVYGLPKRLPVTEDTTFAPRTPYDHSKAVADTLVQSYHAHKKLPTTILRSWKVFGEYDVPTSAAMRFITSCLKNEPIGLYNGGKDTTDPYHVSNLCYAIELALTKQEAAGEAFNLGTGKEVSIRKLAGIIKSLTKSNSKLQNLPPRSELEKRSMRSYPSISKIRRVLGYRPILGLEEGLSRTIAWVSSAALP